MRWFVKSDLFSWEPSAIRDDGVWTQFQEKGEDNTIMRGERLWWIRTSETTANPDHNQYVDWDLFEQQVHVSQHLPGNIHKWRPQCASLAQPQLPKYVKNANSVKRISSSSSNTSPAGWEENLGSVHKLEIGQRALNTLGCGGTCRRNRRLTFRYLLCG